VCWFALGACVGSFLTVCIYRMPREQSIVRPRSRCPHCQQPIAWSDNIPLVSFIRLRGRCRRCREAIHWRYPVVELLTALATVAVFSRFGMGPAGWVYLAFVYGLIVSSFIDLEFRIIPDEISVGGLVVGVACSLLVPALHDTGSRSMALIRSGIGLLVGGGLLYATGAAGDAMLVGLRRLGVALRRRPFWRRKLSHYRHMRESMGGGDIKLMAMAGSILGWKPVAMAFFLAPFVAVLPGLVTLVLKRSSYIPYGPFLSLALAAALFFGEDVLRATGIEDTLRAMRELYGPR
jgi:leader peptidase (prepilin peptidase)/N-methyltransferase